MARWNRYTAIMTVAVLLIVTGCASTPLQTVKADTTANFQRYSTLVVKDFENAAGDGVPSQIRQEVARAVITRLNECYPGAFAKVETTPSGSAEELVVAGTITEYREGSRFARAMLIGLGSAKFASKVSYVDGQTGHP